MPKYLIVWDYGCGEMSDVVSYENHEFAEEEAYERWRDGAESQAEYRAEPLTEENAGEYGHEDEL
jgi:hypothetical protein